MFINRIKELAFLTDVLERQHPGSGQFVMLYGRRRVGKTALLRYWVEQSGLPFTYWVAEKDPAPLQRRKFFGALLDSLGTELPVPPFESWAELWRSVAQLTAARRHLIILDELPYAAESDPAMLSALQHAWDQLFQHSQAVIVICGSHVRSMELLLGRQSPLFGRMTGQWYLQPLSFGALRQFLPAWSPDEQVAAYAIVGGIPAYLAWLNPHHGLTTNIKHVMLAPGSLVLAEATFLLQDEVREPRPYLAVLQAIGNGSHTLKDIANASMISTAHLSFYLGQLQELRLVERRIPATLTRAVRNIGTENAITETV
jgi:AAA+ ATPase superfamily predicted ATPase